MVEVVVLSSKYYGDYSSNYGDCFIINTGTDIVVYDCVCEEHANKVIRYLNKYNIDKAIFVLSHNDNDHFLGLNKLLAENRISVIKTNLLYKYTQDILNTIGDGRRKPNKIIEDIQREYANIASLSGKPIEDIYWSIF